MYRGSGNRKGVSSRCSGGGGVSGRVEVCYLRKGGGLDGGGDFYRGWGAESFAKGLCVEVQGSRKEVSSTSSWSGGVGRVRTWGAKFFFSGGAGRRFLMEEVIFSGLGGS